MDDTLEAIVGPYFKGNPSSMATLLNSTAPAISESSEAHHLPYICQFKPKLPTTDQDLLEFLKNEIHGLSDDEMKKYLDSYFLDPTMLPNASDDGGIYCWTKLRKFKDGGTNFKRDTASGNWKKSHSVRPVYIKGNNEGEKVQLGFKTSLYYECMDKGQSDRWLMKQYTLHRSQWPQRLGEECEMLALCHIYLEHSRRNQGVHNGSSSSLTSGGEPSQNSPVLAYPLEPQSSSHLAGEQIGANFCTTSSVNSNLCDPENNVAILLWDPSVEIECESQFLNQNFANRL